MPREEELVSFSTNWKERARNEKNEGESGDDSPVPVWVCTLLFQGRRIVVVELEVESRVETGLKDADYRYPAMDEDKGIS